MKYLIDTHILLWYAQFPEKLSPKVISLLNNGENKIYVSQASLWEMSIKRSLGKLNFNESISQLVYRMNINFIEILNFDLTHFEALEKLPFYHQDPFDRMLVAQAKVEKMTFITQDSKLSYYDSEVAILRN